jgi:hypothetical protein
MTVGLRHAQVNRHVRTAAKLYHVIKGNALIPVGFGQAANARL